MGITPDKKFRNVSTTIFDSSYDCKKVVEKVMPLKWFSSGHLLIIAQKKLLAIPVGRYQFTSPVKGTHTLMLRVHSSGLQMIMNFSHKHKLHLVEMLLYVSLGYSCKNIPLAQPKTFLKCLIEKTESLLGRMRWKAFCFSNPEAVPSAKETFGFKSTKSPKPLADLKEFLKF